MASQEFLIFIHEGEILDLLVSQLKFSPTYAFPCVAISALMVVMLFINQIASHVQPLDLLYLSRTTRTIRSILMSKRSKPIWCQARKNYPVEFPECPTDLMNEPQFAAVVFDKYCQVRNILVKYFAFTTDFSLIVLLAEGYQHITILRYTS